MNYFMTPTLGDQKIGNFFLPILSKGLWAKYSKPKNRLPKSFMLSQLQELEV